MYITYLSDLVELCHEIVWKLFLPFSYLQRYELSV